MGVTRLSSQAPTPAAACTPTTHHMVDVLRLQQHLTYRHSFCARLARLQADPRRRFGAKEHVTVDPQVVGAIPDGHACSKPARQLQQSVIILRGNTIIEAHNVTETMQSLRPVDSTA